jgi:hypothetical protein
MILEIGRLTRTDIIHIIRDSEKPYLREKFANWLLMLDCKELKEVPEPHQLVLVITDSSLVFEMKEVFEGGSGGSACKSAETTINPSMSVAGVSVENPLKQKPVADEGKISREPAQNPKKA